MWLVLAIVCVVDLNCIICKMDVGLKVANIERISRGANITLLVPVGSCHSIEICHENVMSDIEFALVVEKRTINIFLNDVGLWGFTIIAPCFLCLFLCLFYQIIEFIDLINDYDSIASIAILSWLDNPYISFFFLSLLGDGLCSLLKIVDKLSIFWIFESFFDVKCQRNVREDVLIDFSVIFF